MKYCLSRSFTFLLIAGCHTMSSVNQPTQQPNGEDATQAPDGQPAQAPSGAEDAGLHVSGNIQHLLGSGLVLAQGGEQITITAGASSFSFPQKRTEGDAYSVTLITQPSHPNQTCTLTNAAGTVGPLGASNVHISCVTHVYTLTFQASGHGETVMVAGHPLSDSGDLSIDDGTALELQVVTHPLGEHCYFVYGGERIDGADLSVQATCEAKYVTPAYPLNGAEFGDWIEADGSDRTDASDTPCETAGPARPMTACIPAGQQVQITFADLHTCAGISVTDLLGVHDWACRVVGQQVRIVSVGLKPGVTPSALIDWTANPRNWKQNQVTVNQAAVTILTTLPVRFYHDVLPFSSTLADKGRVYAVDAVHPFISTGASAAGITVVFAPDYALGSSETISVSSSAPFFWFIGNDLARGNSVFGLRLSATDARFLRVNHAGFQGTASLAAASLQNTAPFVLRDVSAMKSSVGFDIGGSSNYGALYRVVAANNGTGLRVNAVNAGDDAPRFLVQDAAFYNSTDGVLIQNQKRVTLQNVSIVGATDRGIELQESGASLLHNVTVEKALTTGLVVNDLNGARPGGNHISSLLAVGGEFGVSIIGAAANHYSNIVTHRAGIGLRLLDAGYNVFAGWLKIGYTTTYTCSVDPVGSTANGVLHDSCNPSAQSSSVFRHLVPADNVTVGQVLRNDTENTSDAAAGSSVGRATYAAVMDWLGSEFPFFRGWARATLDGSCSIEAGSTTCAVTDVSLRTSDQSDPGQNGVAGDIDDTSAALNVLDCPTLDDVKTHVWGATRSQTYLSGPVERIDDGIGNDDGLCESNETCVLSPNIGSYQGSGALIAADQLVAHTPVCATEIDLGGLNGIRLLKYEKNGRNCALADHDGAPGTAMETVCE